MWVGITWDHAVVRVVTGKNSGPRGLTELESKYELDVYYGNIIHKEQEFYGDPVLANSHNPFPVGSRGAGEK